MTDPTLLYGMTVQSEVELHQRRSIQIGDRPDLQLARGPEVERSTPPVESELTLAYEFDDELLYYAHRLRDGRHRLVFSRSCEFEISDSLDRAVVRRYPGADPGIESVLASGSFMAWQLYVRRHLVLHASAVAVDDAAIAFVGNSGMGKSTMATLMCAAGAGLITDDVLRVDDVESTPVTRLGATGLRLRKGADTLRDRFADDQVARQTSADKRQVLSPAGDPVDRMPLRAIVIPRPDREISTTEIEVVPPKQALMWLLGFPRLLGWRDPSILQTQFGQFSALVTRVPVLMARVPWGPPFLPDLADQVIEGITAAVGPSPRR